MSTSGGGALSRAIPKPSRLRSAAREIPTDISATPGPRYSRSQRAWAVATQNTAVGSHRLFAWFTGVAYMLAGTVGGVSLVLGSSDEATLWIEWFLAGCCVTGGHAIMRFGHRLPLGGVQDQIFIFAGIVLVTLSVGYIGRPSASVDTALLYFLPALGCASFFSWIKALPQMIFLEVCSMVAFAHAGVRESDVIILQVVIFATACMVAWLARAAAAGERDSLTGLANRRKFDRRLSETISRAERNGEMLSVVLLDLDDFKDVNDVYGHGEGDRLLVSVSNTWSSLLESGQLLCRQGGDEFALILPGYSANQAAALGDQMREAVKSEISCSVGVAELQLRDSRTKMLGRADVALYESKNRGGGRTSQHGVATNHDAAEEIYQALAAGQFLIHFQPVVDLKTGDVIGDEALVRWNHPERGFISPDFFIPDAEKSGAIHALGAWVLEKSCASTANYNLRTGRRRTIAVNASGHELRNPQYADMVAAMLVRVGLAPQRLTIEVTESTFDADYPQVIETLGQLRKLGVEIAIDDFGTGYSSLSRLDRLPATVLKIDQAFVASIALGGKKMAVLKTIVALAQALELTIIAEGVETPYHADILRELGCSLAQGYYFGRPLAELLETSAIAA